MRDEKKKNRIKYNAIYGCSLVQWMNYIVKVVVLVRVLVLMLVLLYIWYDARVCKILFFLFCVYFPLLIAYGRSFDSVRYFGVFVLFTNMENVSVQQIWSVRFQRVGDGRIEPNSKSSTNTSVLFRFFFSFGIRKRHRAQSYKHIDSKWLKCSSEMGNVWEPLCSYLILNIFSKFRTKRMNTHTQITKRIYRLWLVVYTLVLVFIFISSSSSYSFSRQSRSSSHIRIGIE